VRFHGATSQAYPKKSFGLTLDAPVHWLGMRESTHWVLNAAHVDRSLMRHKLSYDLFRALSAGDAERFAAASRFVELNLNAKYHGAYLLMERVDRAMLELRSYDSNAASQACIYKAVDHDANFSHSGHAGYEQREPDPLVRPYWKPLDEFNRFVSTAPDPEFFHPETGISSRLDLDNAIDFHLLVLLSSNMDGIDKNFIFARDALKQGGPRPRFFFAPWDYDATFGRNWNAVRVEPTVWLSNHLFDRLLKDAAYRKRFAARWKSLRAREFSISNVERLIDENARTLGDATKRNTARWRTLTGYPDRLSFAGDVTQMKEWIRARVQWLDHEIEQQTSR
jgi:spore coat protein H